MTSKDSTTPESGPYKEAEAARLLGMSQRQLRAVRAAGLIGYFDISAGTGVRQHVRYTREHVEAFRESRTHRVSSPTPADSAVSPAPRSRRNRVTPTAKPRDEIAETVARSIARGEVSEWGR